MKYFWKSLRMIRRFRYTAPTSLIPFPKWHRLRTFVIALEVSPPVHPCFELTFKLNTKYFLRIGLQVKLCSPKIPLCFLETIYIFIKVFYWNLNWRLLVKGQAPISVFLESGSGEKIRQFNVNIICHLTKKVHINFILWYLKRPLNLVTIEAGNCQKPFNIDARLQYIKVDLTDFWRLILCN